MVEMKRYERTVFSGKASFESFSKQVTAVNKCETHPTSIPYSNDTIGCCGGTHVAEASTTEFPKIS